VLGTVWALEEIPPRGANQRLRDAGDGGGNERDGEEKSHCQASGDRGENASGVGRHQRGGKGSPRVARARPLPSRPAALSPAPPAEVLSRSGVPASPRATRSCAPGAGRNPTEEGGPGRGDGHPAPAPPPVPGARLPVPRLRPVHAGPRCPVPSGPPPARPPSRAEPGPGGLSRGGQAGCREGTWPAAAAAFSSAANFHKAACPASSISINNSWLGRGGRAGSRAGRPGRWERALRREREPGTAAAGGGRK
jgi:hypothetical protein